MYLIVKYFEIWLNFCHTQILYRIFIHIVNSTFLITEIILEDDSKFIYQCWSVPLTKFKPQSLSDWQKDLSSFFSIVRWSFAELFFLLLFFFQRNEYKFMWLRYADKLCFYWSDTWNLNAGIDRLSFMDRINRFNINNYCSA